MSGVSCTGLFGGDLGLLRGETLVEEEFDSLCASRSSRKHSSAGICGVTEPGDPPLWEPPLKEDVPTCTHDSEVSTESEIVCLHEDVYGNKDVAIFTFKSEDG